jgi:hypothetical protein
VVLPQNSASAAPHPRLLARVTELGDPALDEALDAAVLVEVAVDRSPRSFAAVLEAAGASALVRVGALLATRTP